ncbi:MAG: hypothetical protein KDA37_04605 [Planctomycetales bacterium]|nr:hypothetical protein [Planctomycetales bacterium]
MITRRRFLASTAAASAGLAASPSPAAPAAITTSKTDTEIILGEGDYRYRVTHDWLQLPRKYSWQTTHNVAVDSQGLVYVIHQGHKDEKDHPTIFVFDPQGAYIRSFGAEFRGGGHGIEVRQEAGQDFLYVAAYKEVKAFAKLDTQGEVVWTQKAPMASGRYADGEDTASDNRSGRDAFLPTNFAFLDDGGFLLADGYGAYCIHHYDSQGEWQSSFGGAGKGPAQFDLPHGLWVDRRGAGEPLVVVADRQNARLQWLTLGGQHVRTQEGFHLPANLDTHGELLLVPDLLAEVVLLDGQNNVVARLGHDADWAKQVGEMKIRAQPQAWPAGRFIHPHDACFDHHGDILVAEWVSTGRVSKLTRV